MTVWFSGSSLDTTARRPLWQYGLDFGHGTGHGIGMFLNVHEGKSVTFILLVFCFFLQNQLVYNFCLLYVGILNILTLALAFN